MLTGHAISQTLTYTSYHSCYIYLLLTDTSQLIPDTESVNLTIGHLADGIATIFWNSLTLLTTLNIPLYSFDQSLKFRPPAHLTLSGKENIVNDSAKGGGVVWGYSDPEVSISSIDS